MVERIVVVRFVCLARVSKLCCLLVSGEKATVVIVCAPILDVSGTASINRCNFVSLVVLGLSELCITVEDVVSFFRLV